MNRDQQSSSNAATRHFPHAGGGGDRADARGTRRHSNKVQYSAQWRGLPVSTAVDQAALQ